MDVWHDLEVEIEEDEIKESLHESYTFPKWINQAFLHTEININNFDINIVCEVPETLAWF